MYINKIKTIKLNKDNDDLIKQYLGDEYIVKINKIITKRTGLEEWTKIVMYQVYSNISYEDLVVRFVREKYSADDEYKLHREAFIYGVGNEFIEYNNYVEDCRIRAKAFIEEREEWLNDVR